MFSAIFVDRPRLAIVIAIVTTIAGALAYIAMPVAQYPDIVPPQVSVTTIYPGANSAVVDATVAQPIEAQVVGVDKMIYMKSTSGDDGSYTLTASFELGTDPDINTVNVNNRVQTALSLLPPEVQRQGINVKKKSTAILAFVTVYSPKHTHDPLFLSNYVTINLLDSIKSTPGVGDAYLFAAQDYAMRAWVKTERLTGLNLTVNDIITAIQSQNIQAAVGRIGARPMFDDQQLQLNIQTKGRLSSTEEFDNIVIRTNPDGSILRLRDVAQLELGAANLDRDTRFNGDNAAAIVIYQSPGGNAIDTVDALRAKARRRWRSAFPEDLRLDNPLRSHRLREGYYARSEEDAVRGLRSRGAGGLPVPRKCTRHLDSDPCRAGKPDWHIHRAQGGRIFRQHRVAARHRARDRHRRRRCHRGRRERRAGDGRAPELSPARGEQARDGAKSRRRSSRSRWFCCRCSCRSRSSRGSPANCSASSR